MVNAVVNSILREDGLGDNPILCNKLMLDGKIVRKEAVSAEFLDSPTIICENAQPTVVYVCSSRGEGNPSRTLRKPSGILISNRFDILEVEGEELAGINEAEGVCEDLLDEGAETVSQGSNVVLNSGSAGFLCEGGNCEVQQVELLMLSCADGYSCEVILGCAEQVTGENAMHVGNAQIEPHAQEVNAEQSNAEAMHATRVQTEHMSQEDAIDPQVLPRLIPLRSLCASTDLPRDKLC